MDWVKLSTRYYRDLEIAKLDDTAEVMFTRGLALAGDIESGGLIPNELVATLARRPQQAKRIAARLVTSGRWEKVDGGYQVVNWHEWQAELERLVAKKKRDRDRKRRERGSVRGLSVDASADSPTPNPGIESKRESKTAAAAAGAAAAAVDNLPTSVAILRDKLQAHTPLQALRFDGLTLDRLAQLEALIDLHGDNRLINTALRTLRTPPPVHVSAFLGTWAALPAPGTRLALVKTDLCTVHNQRPLDDGTCPSCAADRLAGDA